MNIFLLLLYNKCISQRFLFLTCNSLFEKGFGSHRLTQNSKRKPLIAKTLTATKHLGGVIQARPKNKLRWLWRVDKLEDMLKFKRPQVCLFFKFDSWGHAWSEAFKNYVKCYMSSRERKTLKSSASKFIKQAVFCFVSKVINLREDSCKQPLHKQTQISESVWYLSKENWRESTLHSILQSWREIISEYIKIELRMEDLLNEISSLMPILTHIRLSGQRVHSRDSVSIVTYANLVLLSEMHES